MRNARRTGSERVYRTLLRIAYPRAFRDRFSLDMLDTFLEELQAAESRGRLAALRCWGGALWDACRFGLVLRVASFAAGSAQPLRRHGGNRGRWPSSALRLMLKASVRQTLRQPLASSATIIVAAVGIATSAGLFAVADGVLMKPLGVHAADRAVAIGTTLPHSFAGAFGTLSTEDIAILRQRPQFDSVSGYQWGGFDADVAELDGVRAVIVEQAFFEVTGTTLLRGRALAREDFHRAEPVSALISEDLWQTRFHGLEAVVGSVVRLAGRPVLVVGVIPRGSAFPRNANVWVPDPGVSLHGMRYLVGIGRLSSAADAGTLSTSNPDFLFLTLQEHSLPSGNRSLLLMLGGAAALSLLTCFQVGGYLSGRVLRAFHATNVKRALGASRYHLMLEPLCAGGIVGSAAILLACLLTPLITHAFVVTLPSTLTVGQLIEVDWRTIGFACALGTAGIAAMTVAAMLLVARQPAGGAVLRVHGAPPTAPLHMRRALLFSQLLVAGALVYAGTVAVTLFARLDEQHFGFRPAELVEVQLEAGLDADSMANVLAWLRASPVVRAAAATDSPPLKRGRVATFVSSTAPTSVDDRGREALQVMVSPGYFATLELTLVAGRDFTDADLASQERMVVVSRQLASEAPRPWDLVGTTLFVGGLPHSVIGVVEDIRGESADQTFSPYVYTKPWMPLSTLLVRTALPMAEIARAAEGALDDAGAPVRGVRFARPLERHYHEALAPHRARALILAMLATISLLVTGGGVFGLVSLAVNSSMRDVAIRIVLGSAATSEAVGLVTRVGALGLVSALSGVFSAVLAASLYGPMHLMEDGVSVTATLLSLIVCVTAVVCAALLPARRLITMSPAAVLRDE